MSPPRVERPDLAAAWEETVRRYLARAEVWRETSPRTAENYARRGAAMLARIEAERARAT